jgi:hypothetical protein
MSDRVTIDVIDRPAGGLRHAVRHVKAIRSSRPPGLRALLWLRTAGFAPRPVPAPTPRRLAVLAAWDDHEEVEGHSSDALARLATGAHEHWHVAAEVVRASFSTAWNGWMPDTTGARPLDPAEPALIVISGDLRARYLPAFLADGARAVAHAFEQPGYRGGLVISSSPLNTTSCSCWRSYQEARDYAFNPGGHLDAVRRDRSRRQHKTDYFLRLRPLAERGTLAGRKPFASLLLHMSASSSD